MARIVHTHGACPVCDRDVRRSVHTRSGISREVFVCPSHGRLDYETGVVPLASLQQAFVRPLTTHGIAAVA